MSTIEEFEKAPVGSTARKGKQRYIKTDSPNDDLPWSVFAGGGDSLMLRDNQDLADLGFTLDPVAPTTSREALDLAWDLAYEVREGQVIPKGTRYLGRHSEPLQEYTATDDIEIVSWLVGTVRTHEPLPDPGPGWLDAPAILADCRYCDDSGHQVLHKPNINGSHWECTVCLTTTGYKSLENVVALYPEESNGGMYITESGEIQFKDRNGQIVWEI